MSENVFRWTISRFLCRDVRVLLASEESLMDMMLHESHDLYTLMSVVCMSTE